ncbi:MAG: homoserine kinase [Alphaproteobacteria bacterium]
MAVYTPVSRTDLTGFLRAYDIGRLQDHAAIAEGIENSNYRLETDRGRFILTLYEKRVREADLPFFLALMSHLQESGLPCPRPVAGRDSIVLRRLNGRPAAIVTFLPGKAVARPDTARTRAAGAVLARLHEAARGFAGSRANDLGPCGWRKLHEDCRARAGEVKPGLADIVGRELDFLERAWPGNLPRGVIHGDLFPDNVLYEGARVSGVIDFYFAAEDMLAFDLAICLNAWCFAGGEFLPAHARALVAGYEDVRPLGPAERAALPVLARGAAMRFLLTRLYDWLHPEPDALVTPKDPLGFLERLRFHQRSNWLSALA